MGDDVLAIHVHVAYLEYRNNYSIYGSVDPTPICAV